MPVKIEITITDNEKYMFIYIAKDGKILNQFSMRKTMGIVTRSLFTRNIAGAVRNLLIDVINRLVKGD